MDNSSWSKILNSGKVPLSFWDFLRKKRSLILKAIILSLKTHWILTIFAFVLHISVRCVHFVQPLIWRRLIDTAIPNKDYNELKTIAIVAILFPVFSQALEFAKNYFDAMYGLAFRLELKELMYKKLQVLGLRFYISTDSAEISMRLTTDVKECRNLQRFILHATCDIFQILATIFVMARIDFSLTLTILLMYPIIYYPSNVLAQKLSAYMEERAADWVSLHNFVKDTTSADGALLTKLFGLQRTNMEEFSKRIKEEGDKEIKYFATEKLFWAFIKVVSSVFTAVVYWMGGCDVIEGFMTIGALFAFHSYMQSFYKTLTNLLNDWMEVIKDTSGFERIAELLDLPVEVEERPNAMELKNISGYVDFEDVSFKYSDWPSTVKGKFKLEKVQRNIWQANVTRKGQKLDSKDKQASSEFGLSNIRVSIKPGQMCAVVGFSGAGKSTLIHLLLRLYDVTSGSIKIDGVDIRDVKLSSLAKILSVVPQECVLFNDTILNNIRLANMEATEDQIIEACRIANVYAAIKKFPKGMQTIVGNNGMRLSGGEKQRIAIARAILTNPKILILDEATSSLDSINESSIQQSLEPLMQGRTCFVIAHRLATIRKADWILVLKNGEVVEQGTHEDLLQLGGLFSELYRTQFRDN